MAAHAVNATSPQLPKSLLDLLHAEEFEPAVAAARPGPRIEQDATRPARLSEQVEAILRRGRSIDAHGAMVTDAHATDDQHEPDRLHVEAWQGVDEDDPLEDRFEKHSGEDIQKFATAAALLGEMAHRILRQAEPHSADIDAVTPSRFDPSSTLFPGAAAASTAPALESRLDRLADQMADMSDTLSRQLAGIAARLEDIAPASQYGSATEKPQNSPSTISPDEKMREFIRAITDFKEMRDRIQSASLDRRPAVR